MYLMLILSEKTKFLILFVSLVLLLKYRKDFYAAKDKLV